MPNWVDSKTRSKTLWTSTPASTRRAASRSASGLVVRYWNRPGVGDQADVEGLCDLRRDLDAEAVEDPRQDLGRRRRVPVDEVDVAEAAVVVVVVDVDDAAGARAQRLVDLSEPALVAAVDDEQRPPLDLGRVDVALQAVGVEEAHLVRDRRRRLEVHAHLLSQLAQARRRGGHRSDRVAVGVLVRRDQDAVGRGECCDGSVRVAFGCDVGHSGSGSAGGERSWAMISFSRIARSRVSS